VDDFLSKADAKVRDTYKALEGLIARCGPYSVSAAKTRIAFMGLVRFAGVSRVTRRGLLVGFALPEPRNHARFVRVKEDPPGSGWWGHFVELTDPKQADEQLFHWLKESYELFGMRGRLSGRKG
jgi:hypothetical protein